METIILDFIVQNGHIFRLVGYYIIFIFSLVESFPVLGFIIPGQSLIIASGFLAKNHTLSFWLVFMTATIGAILGDFIAYHFGKKYGEDFLRKHGSKFFVKESLINKTKELLNDHPGKALLFGRLNSVTRSLAPFLAGVSKIKYGLFSFYVIGGCMLWAFLFTSIGFIFGRGFEIAAPIIGKFILVSTIIVIAFMILLNFMKSKGFKLSKYHIHMLTLNFISIYLFATLSEGIARGSKIVSLFDKKVLDLLGKIHTPFLDNIFLTISHINTPELVVGLIVLFLILMVHKEMKILILSSLSLISGYILVFVTKIVFIRERPIISMISETGSSFPSGHATLATLFFLVIIHDFTEHIKNDYKKIFFVSINVFLIFLFSFSRIYLGVHHVTDVIAGISLGVWIFTLTILASKVTPWFYKRRRVSEILKKIP